MTHLGNTLFTLRDTSLKGFLTWMEKNTSAVFLFTTGEKAEEYHSKVFPNRPISVYPVPKARMKDFVCSMLNSGLEYAIIDVPWQHADVNEVYEDEVVRDYAIVDLHTVRARM
tara:strand:+ start:91 stop:429 length:339 start_codon:yes stop_codon:yes gene_type:complete